MVCLKPWSVNQTGYDFFWGDIKLSNPSNKKHTQHSNIGATFFRKNKQETQPR
jgi:hypothetical protein